MSKGEDSDQEERFTLSVQARRKPKTAGGGKNHKKGRRQVEEHLAGAQRHDDTLTIRQLTRVCGHVASILFSEWLNERMEGSVCVGVRIM